MRGYPQWRWHLDEGFEKVNGKLCYLWRAVDHEGEVLEAVVTARRDKAAALKLLKRIMKKYGLPRSIVTDGLRAYPAAMNEIGVSAARHEVGGRLNNHAENSHQPFRRRERAMQRSRSRKTLQKLSSVHAQVHNQFNQERHLVTRQVYKQRRSVALAERAPRGIDRRSRDGGRAACRRNLRYLDTAVATVITAVTHIAVVTVITAAMATVPMDMAARLRSARRPSAQRR